MLRAALLLLAVGIVATSQVKTTQGTSPQMNTGALAVVADQEGVLFVDGERKLTIVPDKIITLMLTAGQHFIELRDAKGSRLWEKVITVPVGAQVVERLQLGRSVQRRTASPVPELERWEELPLLGRLYAADDCVRGPHPYSADCGSFVDVNSSEVTKYCSDFDNLAEKITYAGACAGVLYDRGENEKALAKANEAVAGMESFYQSDLRSGGQFKISNSQHLWQVYLVRGRIKYSLADTSGALADLKTTLDYVSLNRKSLEEAAMSSNQQLATVARTAASQPNPDEMNAHLYRAVILSRIGRYADALSDFNEYAAIHAAAGNKNSRVAEKLAQVIRAHTAGVTIDHVLDSSQGDKVATPTTSDADIRSEIDSIARSGQYEPLPDARMIAANRGNAITATRIIRNGTAYGLHVLMSGPVDRKIDLALRGSISTELPPGSYRVAARVDSPEVRPFYGVQVFKAGIEYSSEFYIK